MTFVSNVLYLVNLKMFLEISWARRLSIKAEKAFCTNSLDYFFFIYCVKEVYYDTKCIFLKRLKEWNLFLLKRSESQLCNHSSYDAVYLLQGLSVPVHKCKLDGKLSYFHLTTSTHYCVCKNGLHKKPQPKKD